MLPFVPILALAALALAGLIPERSKRLARSGWTGSRNRFHVNDIAQFNFLPVEVTELYIFCERSNATVDYACALTFDWFDPNSVKENHVTSGTCHSSWSWDGTTKLNSSGDGTQFAVDYRWCWEDEETSFKVAVSSFWSPGDFSLELVHRYHDDENFTRPWDYPTTFALADFHICPEEKQGNMIYHYKPGPVNGTVVGIIA